MPSIVTVNVTQEQAPTPATLQQTGALVSQGATILSAGTFSLLTQLSDLTPLLVGAKSLVSISWSGGVVTATAASPHQFTIGDTIVLTISGNTPMGYNGTFLCTITTTTAFTYAVVSNPGTATVVGAYTPEDVSELLAMATTFFSQGAQLAVYVLELGPGNAADGVAALTNYITQNPNTDYTPGATGFFYAYLVPRVWSNAAPFLSLIAANQFTTAKTYFFVTMTLQNYVTFTDLMKDVIGLIEDPPSGVWQQNPVTAASWNAGEATFTTQNPHGVTVGEWFQMQGFTPLAFNGWYQAGGGTGGNTLVAALQGNPGAVVVEGTLEASNVTSTGVPTLEFSSAFPFWEFLHYLPSTTNKVTPFAFSFGFGVTPFKTQGRSALLSTLKAANVNYIGTGAEGGITNTILLWGTTMDGRDATYWYSVDWAQINSDLNISNAIINGSNNPLNPLYYSQDGINRLQDTVVATMNTAISVGLANGTVTRTALDGPAFTQALDSGQFDGQIVVNAVPLLPYLTVNPSDYKIGRYAGLSVQYIPNRGFISIVFNINVTDFIVAR